MGFTTVFEFSLYAILALYLTDDIVFLYLGKIAVSWLINFDVAIFIPDFLGYLDETEQMFRVDASEKGPNFKTFFPTTQKMIDNVTFYVAFLN